VPVLVPALIRRRKTRQLTLPGVSAKFAGVPGCWQACDTRAAPI
jgi:hypothetical protein